MKIKSLLFVGLLAVSCSDDQVVTPIPQSPPTSDFSGTYRLVELNTSLQTDLNGDNIFSTNQMEETDCYNETIFTFHPNYTMTSVGGKPNISGSGVVCSEASNSSTWTKNGNLITIYYSSNNVQFTEEFTLSENQQTLSEFLQGLFIISNLPNGNLTTTQAADIERIFIKE